MRRESNPIWTWGDPVSASLFPWLDTTSCLASFVSAIRRRLANVLLRPGIAAGHPATADAGFGVLEDGGTAADAAVAASLASCVAETVMTGIAGGGHALWVDGGSGEVRLLDFFVTVPGLGETPKEVELLDIGVPFPRGDLDEYEPLWLDPVESAYLGHRVLTRSGLTTPLGALLAALPRLRGLSAAKRALTLARVLVALPYSGEPEPLGDTTNLVTADADGHACVVTTSLGLGSGDYLPGLDVHLNSMLGEADLLVTPLEAGERMESMMAPTVVFAEDGPLLVAGAAGGTRLRPALVQVLAGILDEGLEL